MNVIKKNIPNFITLLNLLCGSISIVFALNNHIEIASILIFLGVFLDFFDGFFARIFKSENDFGSGITIVSLIQSSKRSLLKKNLRKMIALKEFKI